MFTLNGEIHMKTNLLSFILLSTTLFSSTCSFSQENEQKEDEIKLWDKKLYKLVGGAAAVCGGIVFAGFLYIDSKSLDTWIGATVLSLVCGALAAIKTYDSIINNDKTYKSKSLYLEAKWREKYIQIDEEIFEQNVSMEKIYEQLLRFTLELEQLSELIIIESKNKSGKKEEKTKIKKIKYEDRNHPLIDIHYKIISKLESITKIIKLYNRALTLNENLKNIIEPRVTYLTDLVKKLEVLHVKIQNHKNFEKQKIEYLLKKEEERERERNMLYMQMLPQRPRLL